MYRRASSELVVAAALLVGAVALDGVAEALLRETMELLNVYIYTHIITIYIYIYI